VPITHPPPPPTTLLPYTTLFRSPRPIRLPGRPDGTAGDSAPRKDSLVRPPPRHSSNRPARLKAMVPGRENPPPTACTSVRKLCRSEEHTSELQSRFDLVCRLLLE